MVPSGKPGQRRYGTWAGCPKGHPEDVVRCAEAIYDSVNRYYSRQCTRVRGFGLNGEFCKQHAKRYPDPKEAGNNE